MGCMAIEVGHHLGVPCLAPGITTDAKEAGIQAGVEKGLKAFPVCATGVDVTSGGMGIFDTSSVIYLPQILIDHEVMRMVRAMLADVPVDAETTAAELIERVGPGGTFLSQRDTRLRMRAGEHLMPEIFTRLAYDQWKEVGLDETATARAKMGDVLRRHAARGPYLTDDQRGEDWGRSAAIERPAVEADAEGVRWASIGWIELLIIIVIVGLVLGHDRRLRYAPPLNDRSGRGSGCRST